MARLESGIAPLRVVFVRETIPGVTPTDPDWLLYSDEIASIGNWSPNSNLAARTKVGDPNVQGFSIGAEDHELTVSYMLQKWLTPRDAIMDAFLRLPSNGCLPFHHSLWIRQTLPSFTGASTGPLRIHTYAKGGLFDTASLTGDPSNSEPILVEGTYRFQKIRSYAVSIRGVPDTLTVVSTSPNDTTQTLVVEAEAAVVSETFVLNGTTPVVGAVTFANIDTFALDLEAEGDIIITYTVGLEEAVRILGSANQQDIEGDLGIPSFGAGSFEAPLNTPFEHVLGDVVVRSSDSELDANLMTIAFNVANNIQVDPIVTQKGKVLSEGNSDVTANVTVFSEQGSHDAIIEHLKANAANLDWDLTQGNIVLSGSVLTSVGARTYEKGAATMRRDNIFTGLSFAVTEEGGG